MKTLGLNVGTFEGVRATGIQLTYDNYYRLIDWINELGCFHQVILHCSPYLLINHGELTLRVKPGEWVVQEGENTDLIVASPDYVAKYGFRSRYVAISCIDPTENNGATDPSPPLSVEEIKHLKMLSEQIFYARRTIEEQMEWFILRQDMYQKQLNELLDRLEEQAP